MIDSTRMTWKGWLTMGLFSALSALVGCDRVATGELQPGQSTVADMKLKMGEPANVYREGDKEVWEYPLGPEGVGRPCARWGARPLAHPRTPSGGPRHDPPERMRKPRGAPWRRVVPCADQRKEVVQLNSTDRGTLEVVGR